MSCLPDDLVHISGFSGEDAVLRSCSALSKCLSFAITQQAVLIEDIRHC